MFPPPCLWMVFLGSGSIPPELMPKSWILVSSDHNTFTQLSSESLTSDMCCTFAFLSRGACGCCMISVLHGIVCYQSDPPMSFWADSFTVLMIIETEILYGAPVRGRLTVILCFFHLWIIAPPVVTFSPSAWRWSCSPFQPCAGLQSHPWRPWTALWSWSWWRVWTLIDWLLLWTGVFYTGNKPFKRVLLISARYLYKRHLGARNLADW